MKKINPFYVLVISIILIIISPLIFSHGMFIDGLLYARIAKNLAHGIGSFWQVQYSVEPNAFLLGQPPLGFGLQSIFFKLFGDSYLVERFYSLFVYILTGIIMYRIWKIIKGNDAQRTAWLPILLWGLTPLVFWAMTNNMLENTMMVFTTLSVFLILKSYNMNSTKPLIKSENKHYLYLALSGFSISCAFLVKGFTGVFTLSFIFWLWIFMRNISFKRCLLDTSVLLLCAALPFVLIYFFYQKAFTSLESYFYIQVVESIENLKTVDSRFFILRRLFEDLVPAFIIIITLYIITYKQKIENKNIQWVLCFLALGLSGVIPIMVSLKQSAFYMLCALPFFSITLAYAIEPRLSFLLNKINENSKAYKLFRRICFLLFFLAITLLIFKSGRIGRDKDKLADIFAIAKIVPQEEIISIDSSLSGEWNLRDYFGRYFNIVLDAKYPPYHKYILVHKTNSFIIPPGYEKDTTQLKLYDLYVFNPSQVLPDPRPQSTGTKPVSIP